MKHVRLGRTGLEASRIGFGGLQIATRCDYPEAERLLNLALDLGINILDTAAVYEESEERIGRAISRRREEFLVATKTTATTRAGFWEDLERSLTLLRTDHVDIYQFHGAERGSEEHIFRGESIIECMQQAREQGKVRFIGFSSHCLEGTVSHMRTGAFDIVQYPVSYVGNEAAEQGVVEEAAALDLGFLGMKPFGGGRLGRARYCLGYVFQFPSVVPLIGFHKEADLREAAELAEAGVALSEADRREMERIKAELGEKFCRGCGYCQPCPQEVPILTVMFFDVFRKQYGDEWVMRDEFRKEIELVERCEDCRQCVERCPFDLEIPAVMREIVARYEEVMKVRQGGEGR